MTHSTGNNIDDIPLAPIHVEETQQPEASTSQQRHNSETNPMVESVADDGYRLHRRQKNKPQRAAQALVLHRNDPGITEDPEVKKTAASPPTTAASNEENAEGEIEGGSEEHPLRRLADGEMEPPGGENAVEDMDVDEADRGARTSGHSDTELSIGNAAAVLAKESPAVSDDGEETSGECVDNLPDGQVTEGNSSSMHEVLTNWMEEYGGHHVKLTENGQSLYQAYYAATSNPNGDRLVMAEEDTRALNIIKRNVLNLLFTRLRYDIQLDLVQPHKELTRMYPAIVAPNTSTGATAKLYAHFAADRQVCTSTTIFSRARAPQIELRALAVFSREPIYVWTIGDNGATRLDQYTVHTYEMQNGDAHETGIEVELSQEAVRQLLRGCATAQVVPIMLTVQEGTSEFQGISLNKTFSVWNSQPGTSMRDRLDCVHSTLGFAQIYGVPFEYASLPDAARSEEQLILEDLGMDVYASGAHEHDVNDPTLPAPSKRTPVSGSNPVHIEVYSRILSEASPQLRPALDGRIASRLDRANAQAFKKWTEKKAVRVGVARRY
ncbi:hypothetical protein PF004_g7592 [Phytophthora fragariae]|uniref:Uncharacterized protein n=1 Tax=Phytophthora fragariae TaxID=53985 RepID=A0A6A3F5T2_9STRA|nr:hypothetical protein PF009_g9041 [Phytophthora fragariae]KAE9240238.1 hypothetical protein PF004_g7592 [Phytophthora fragariae]